MHGLNKL